MDYFNFSLNVITGFKANMPTIEQAFLSQLKDVKCYFQKRKVLTWVSAM